MNSILDFSKLEAGQVEIVPEPVNVIDLGQDTLAMFTPQAAAKALRLECAAEASMPDHILVDSARLRQILLNLIGNAVKFTDQGSVRLALGYESATGRLEVRVEDTGAGMDEAQTARLFQRFSQVDASSTRLYGGTGLGLAICKGLVEAMGGQIGVQSQPGHGSVFHFEVHAPVAEAEDRQVGQGLATLCGVRVLVADDNAANRELVSALLKAADAEVTFAVDGGEANAMAADMPFDVMLIDLHMPVMDGREVLARVRAAPGPNQTIPVFAFTAEGPDATPCGPGLFDGVIGKPIDAAKTVAAIVQAAAWKTAPGAIDYSRIGQSRSSGGR